MNSWVLWVQSKNYFLCWNCWKKKKNQKQPVGKMLKVLNLEVCNTDTYVRPVSCVAGDGQKVKSNNSCSRTLAPPNQLSTKQPEPPVTSQSQHEGLPDFPREAAMLSNYSTYAVPFRRGRKICILFLKTLVYLLDCWNGEKVANRKHQKGLKV